MRTYQQEIINKAMPLKDETSLKSLINSVKDKKIVMIGEASHGTQDYYKWRQLISQELITQHGFNFISVEGDWPACQRINQFIKGQEHGDSHKILSTFDRWPTWMWANLELVWFTDWLKEWNEKADPKVSFYGLDIYSFYESVDLVLSTLRTIDPDLAKLAEQKYACLEPFRHDEKLYAKSLFKTPEGCKKQVLDVLKETLEKKIHTSNRSETWFDIQQNAQIVANAENYYRAMVFGEEDSWNVRDKHMMSTIEMLLEHHGTGSKAIVWAHNTHVGDYRATDMVTSGHLNIGGLAREIFGNENVGLIGFGSYDGSVTASYMWNGPILKYDIPEARPGSVENACHQVIGNVGCSDFYLMFDPFDHGSPLNQVMDHRAIGVVYDPDIEHRGNYVPTSLSNRYDAFIFIDRSNSLTPIQAHFDKKKFPETYPFGNRM